jgi:predicted TIM-barrel fold metal-dependent hydrolase
MATTAVIDADSHISEPPDLWTSRVPRRYVDDVPTLVRTDDGLDAWTMGGRSLGSVGRNAVAGWPGFPPELPKTMAETLPASYDAGARLAYMDEAGIWAQVLYPNVAGFGAQNFLRAADEALKLLCVQAYNDFLVDWCAADPTRLLGVMALPFWDVAAAVKEVERGAAAGLRGVLFTGEPQRFGLPPLGHPHWDPLYAACQAAGLPMHFHIGGGEVDVGADITPERIGAHGYPGTEAYVAVQLFMKNGIQCADLITCGLLPRFPELRFVSVESGTGWLPFMLEAADWSYLGATQPGRIGGASQPGHVATEGLLPSELFARQVYVTYWFEHAAPTFLTEALPIDNVLFETDFPHTACLYGNIQETIDHGLAHATDEVRRKFLWENAARLYGIPDPPPTWRPGEHT